MVRASSRFLLSPTMDPRLAGRFARAAARQCPGARPRASLRWATCRRAWHEMETLRALKPHAPIRSFAVHGPLPSPQTDSEHAECRRGCDVALIHRSLAKAGPDTRARRAQAESQTLHRRWPYPISLSSPSHVTRFRGRSRDDFLRRDLQHRLPADVHEA